MERFYRDEIRPVERKSTFDPDKRIQATKAKKATVSSGFDPDKRIGSYSYDYKPKFDPDKRIEPKVRYASELFDINAIILC